MALHKALQDLKAAVKKNCPRPVLSLCRNIWHALCSSVAARKNRKYAKLRLQEGGY